MRIEDSFGKSITNIYCRHKYELYGLNEAFCFIELDSKLIIDFPWSIDNNIAVSDLDPAAKSIFPNPRKNLYTRLFKSNLTTSPILNQKIVDFIYYDEPTDKGYFELENGSIITEINSSPQGTGHEGINYYKDISALADRFGTNFKRLSEKQSR